MPATFFVILIRALKMDKIIFTLLRTVWGRSVLWFFILACSATVAWLAYENKELVEERSACEARAVETERRCSEQVDKLRREQIQHLREIISKQEAQEKRRKK